jgi:two-component sensor histidine kinase
MCSQTPDGGPPGQIDYRLLFETMSEGVVLCEPICDDRGRLTDYLFVQANPAFLRGFRGGDDIVGRRFRELRPDATPDWFANFQTTIDTGEPHRFQYQDAARHRWYDVHCTRISPNRIAHFYIDITWMKRAEAHQATQLDELNHRVKNNLAIVASLLSLQARDAPPEVANHLNAAISRVHAVADLHAELYRSHHHEVVAMDHYLQELVMRLSRSLLDDRIRLRVEAEPIQVDLSQAVQLGLVVNELVTNALKHAFPDPERSGQISIGLVVSDGRLRLTVRDNGAGLPPEGQRHRGLGTRVVESFVQQCGGTLVATSDRGAGFEVAIPWRPPIGHPEARPVDLF